MEGALVEEKVEALAGREAALLVLRPDPFFSPAHLCLPPQAL
jgi:hypothetical protein